MYTTVHKVVNALDYLSSATSFRLVRLPLPRSSYTLFIKDQLADHHLINHHHLYKAAFVRIKLTCIPSIYHQPSQLLNSPPLNERSPRNTCWSVCEETRSE